MAHRSARSDRSAPAGVRAQLQELPASRRRPRDGGAARRTPLEHTAATRSRNAPAAIPRVDSRPCDPCRRHSRRRICAPGGCRADCFLVDAGADGSERRARSRCAGAGGPARGTAAARSATASRHARCRIEGLCLCKAEAGLSSRVSASPRGKTAPPRWPDDPVGGLCAPPRDGLRGKSVELSVRRFEYHN